MNISPAIQKFVGRSLLVLKEQSPNILMGVGVVAVVGAGVWAARNTLKLESVVDKGEERLALANVKIENGEASPRDLTVAYIKNVGSVVKLYSGPVATMAAGLVCVLASKHILDQRVASGIAAYNMLQAAHNSYRERVKDEYGEEVDAKFRYGIETETTLDEKGKKKTVVVATDGEHAGGNPFVFVFDGQNPNYKGWHDQNLMFVMSHQKYLNDLLEVRGHVFLNEALDALAIERTEAGQTLGWVRDDEGTGDGYIDFGIRDFQEELGYILLDFNVDGPVAHHLSKKNKK